MMMTGRRKRRWMRRFGHGEGGGKGRDQECLSLLWPPPYAVCHTVMEAGGMHFPASQP